MFEKPVLKGTLAEKTAMQKAARAKFETEHAAWEAEKQAHEQSQGDVEARHAEALDAARKRVEFWRGMSGVATGETGASTDGLAQDTKLSEPATAEAPAGVAEIEDSERAEMA